MTSSCSNLCFS